MSHTTHRSLFTHPVRLLFALALLFGSLLRLVSPHVASAATTYTVSDEASCAAFLTAIGAQGEPYGDCYVYQGTLAAGDTLNIEGDFALRPQVHGTTTANFINYGTVNINTSDGLYNAGILENHGNLNINAKAPNFEVIDNYGTITIGATLYNNDTINNYGTIELSCGGGLVGSGTFTGNPASSTCPDSIPPTASPTQAPIATSADWNNTDVIVSWNWADNQDGSGINTAACPPSSTSSGEGQQTLGASCKDLAGNQGSASYSVKVDKTAPSVSMSGVADGASYTLGAVPAAACSTGDALSGVAAEATLSITDGNADGTGSFTATCAGATDLAGNSAPPISVTYQVTYRWAGFFQPIDNLPTLNSVKAGQAIPVKFNLGGNYGLSIFAAGYPQVQQVACTSGAPIDEVEQTVTAGASGLQYDATTGQYSYVWKTDKAWAGSCRQLVVRLLDGSEHIASFKFK